MANVWRSLTEKEMSGGGNIETQNFGTYFPNSLQQFLIKIGKNSFLKRGVFRGTFTNLILLFSRGPIDITFRDCCFRIWGENNLIEYGLLLNPNYNQMDLEFLLSEAPSDANFVDMGSNIGLYSQPMAKTSPNGTTVSIDANPLMATRLRFNAAATGLKNLKMVSVAVSDTDGQGSLVIRKNDVAIVAIEESDGGAITIKTLESILNEQEITEIYGLKIDIEGHEDKALAPFLLSAPKSQLPKRIVIEHPEPNADYPECAKAFKALNYNLIDRSRNNSFYLLAN